MDAYQKMASLKVRPAPHGWNMLDAQRELQAFMHTYKPDMIQQHFQADTVGELMERFRFNMEAIQVEMVELLDFLPWKTWKSYEMKREDSLDDHMQAVMEMRFELVDLLHFCMNIAIALGMSWDELNAIFFTKHLENKARQERGY